MDKVVIQLDEDSGKLSISSKGFNILELLGILELAKAQVLSGEGLILDEEEEIANKPIKTKGSA